MASIMSPVPSHRSQTKSVGLPFLSSCLPLAWQSEHVR
jgi:hypothetical protein